MPEITISTPHQLSKKDALERIQRTIQNLKKEHENSIQDLQENWNENAGNFSFRAMGFSVSGTIIVKSSAVELSGKMPFLALPFKTKIEQEIQRKLKQLLI